MSVNTDEVLIKVEHASKKFCRSLKRSLWYGAQDVAHSLMPWRKSSELDYSSESAGNILPPLRQDEFWAVQGVSFEVRRGECLGLIGHNGAGKSTLLKMLNSLNAPDTGRITMRGRVGALIELGAGFNPILTGRENVYVNASLLGFSKKEIDGKFDEIVAFSEIGEFIDSPVQNYSSGMKVRLGFSVAAQMEPDILLIDEVLAVGDLGFTIKCLNRIAELLKRCAVIFVSHSMPQVAKICTHCLLLQKGKVEWNTTDTQYVISKYFGLFEAEASQVQGTGQSECLEIAVSNYYEKQDSTYVFQKPDSICVQLKLSIAKEIEKVCVGLSFANQEQRLVAVTNNVESGVTLVNDKEIHELNVQIPNIFSSLKYSVTLGVYELLGEEEITLGSLLLRYSNLFTVIIRGSKMISYTPIQLPAKWEIR